MITMKILLSNYSRLLKIKYLILHMSVNLNIKYSQFLVAQSFLKIFTNSNKHYIIGFESVNIMFYRSQAY